MSYANYRPDSQKGKNLSSGEPVNFVKSSVESISNSPCALENSKK